MSDEQKTGATEREGLMPVPCSDSNLWSIDLVGCSMMFMPSDLRKV